LAEINLIIDNIAKVLFYYLPGYVFLMIFRWCIGKNNFTKDIQLINIVIISVIVVSLVSYLFPKMQSLFILAIAIILSACLAILCALFGNAKWFSNLFSSLFHRTIFQDFWKSVLDPAGTLVQVIREDNSKIAGFFHRMEESGDDRWIQLSSYKVLNSAEEITDTGNKISDVIIKLTSKDTLIFSYAENSPYLQKRN
jgi:hypothetical protein